MRVETAVAGLPDRWMLALPDTQFRRSLPAPLLAHGDVDARAFKLLQRRAGTREGSASAPDANDRHGQIILMHEHVVAYL